jgi:hypothetical protein
VPQQGCASNACAYAQKQQQQLYLLVSDQIACSAVF